MSSIPGNIGNPPINPSNPGNLTPYSIPLTNKPVDTSVFSEQSTISFAPPSFGEPTLPIAEYYKTVNESAINQKIQEFLDSFNDATRLSKFWNDAIDQAIALRDFINQIYDIVNLQNAILKNGQLDQAKLDVNNALAAYNAGVTGPGGDQEQVQTLNNAINDYNNANTNYQNTLQSYNNALTAQQNALNDYNQAVNNYDAALNSYLAGTLDQAGLEAARAQFDAAAANFDNATSNFNFAQSTLDSAEANLAGASNALQTATTNYNNYVQTRAAAVNAANDAVNAWNELANKRNIQIIQLNQLRAALQPPLPPVPLIPTIPQINGLQPFTIPGGSVPPIAVSINQRIGNYNGQASSLSNYIASQLNWHIFSINQQGYQPPLTERPGVNQIPFNDIVGVVSGNIPFLPNPTTVVPVDYIPFVPTDVVTIYLAPRMIIIDQLKQSKENAANYQKLMDNLTADVPDSSGKENVVGGAGASIAMSTITPKTLLSSPFIDSILSKQSFEAFFNIHGVPLQSPLVDQIGPVSAQLLTSLGLASVGPASTILGTGSLSNIGKESALSTAISLGFLKQINDFTNSDLLSKTVQNILSNDPTLTDAQKQQLAPLLSASISGSLLEIGLNDVARSLAIPGLTPQILATVAGLTTSDALVALGGQLYAQTLLAGHIEEQFTLSHEEALQASQDALQQIFVGQNTSPQQLQAQIVSAILDQLGDQQADSLAKVRAQEIADAIILQITHDKQVQADIQKDAFRQAVIRGLQRVQNLDEREAARIAGRIVSSGNTADSYSKAAIGILPTVGMTDVEASELVQRAVDAYNTRDPLLNPLSAPSLQKIVSSADLSQLFKTEIVNSLSPVIGNTQALAVAEDYGNLVFTAPNSVLNKLEAIDRQERKSIDSLANRAFDKYLEITKGYKDPSTILERATAPGKALLSAATIGAPSAHGISALDNSLGIGPIQG